MNNIVESLKTLSNGLANNQLNAVQAVQALSSLLEEVNVLTDKLTSNQIVIDDYQRQIRGLENTIRDLAVYKNTHDQVVQMKNENTYNKAVFEVEKKFYEEHFKLLKNTLSSVLQYKTFTSQSSGSYNGYFNGNSVAGDSNSSSGEIPVLPPF